MKSMILANKWDTNGGNARLVAAAKKHGEDLKALIFHSGQDYGGQGGRWAAAAGGTDLKTIYLAAGQDTAGIGSRYAELSKKYDHLTIRAAHRTQTYLDYPYDILWNKTTDALVRQLAKDADVIHLNDRTYSYFELGLDRLAKPALLHHHGMAYRVGSAALNAEARRYGMVQAVSTIDLLQHGDENVVWLPAPYDLEMLADIRRENKRKPDGKIRIVQTPTNRAIKSTDKLEQVVKILQQEGVPIELIVGENMPWREALPLKATADISFDQVQLGYGCSAIEAWGMGIPVIAGGDAWTEARMVKEFGGPLPYYRAEDSVESIYEAVKALALDPTLRKKWAKKGLDHSRKFHDELPALIRVVGLYLQAMAQARPVKQPPDFKQFDTGTGGTFKIVKNPSLMFYVDGVRFKFVGSTLVADATYAPLVRWFAARESSKGYGITEVE